MNAFTKTTRGRSNFGRTINVNLDGTVTQKPLHDFPVTTLDLTGAQEYLPTNDNIFELYRPKTPEPVSKKFLDYFQLRPDMDPLAYKIIETLRKNFETPTRWIPFAYDERYLSSDNETVVEDGKFSLIITIPGYNSELPLIHPYGNDSGPYQGKIEEKITYVWTDDSGKTGFGVGSWQSDGSIKTIAIFPRETNWFNLTLPIRIEIAKQYI